MSRSGKDEILLIEHPVLKSNPLPPTLLNEASINLLVVRANRTWKIRIRHCMSICYKLNKKKYPSFSI